MRIKIVVQRYGSDLRAGAERHAALMAGILHVHHDVEVLTTTAGDYQTWADAYPEGESVVEGVGVRRFSVLGGRNPSWSAVSDLLHEGFDPSDFARLPAAQRETFATRVRAWPLPLQEAFIRGQGPVAPDLISYLEHIDFDRVLFVTYLYPTTYDGLLVVDPARARVVPTLHDEPSAYLPAFGDRLRRATLLCSTEAEIDLLTRLYPHAPPTARLLGYGIETLATLPDADLGDPPFLLYAGRIDPQKGIGELLDWYEVLCRLDAAPPRLVLIGEPAMDLPPLAGLDVRGVVSEEEKVRLMRNALALVHPSPFESLGIVLLEALGLETPLLVNAHSDVMVEHCRRGQAGLWIRDGAELTAAVQKLRTSTALRHSLGASGRRYVDREYSLGAYERRLLREFPV